ncbi:hypothetical protein SAMN05660862_2937 [Sphingobacterium psychroaquaticum]|uniref:Tetratricopeptide repeat-containing protein n=2 Tax=Sphingobacterium psychroaquaticum TaxID=561061 RepID=A0A1X7KHL7_9SPHI|nr:hypothetical protein SAMN05660862_2937 [Sphingobacterium psychroaquaticum]
MFTINPTINRSILIVLKVLFFTFGVNSIVMANSERSPLQETFIPIFKKSYERVRAGHFEISRLPAGGNSQEEKLLFIANQINLAKYYVNNDGETTLLSSDLLDEAIVTTRTLNDNGLLVFSLVQRGYHFYRNRKITLAMPDFLEAMFLLERDKKLHPPFAEEVYKEIGFFMGTIGDFQTGINYLLKSMKYTTDGKELAGLFDNLGYYSVQQGNMSAAREYFDKAWAQAVKEKDEVRQAKIMGNQALVELHEKNETKAVELLQADIHISNKHDAQLNTLYATNILADILITQGRFEEAKSDLLKVKGFADKHENLIVRRHKLNEHLLAIAVGQKDENTEIRLRRLLAKMQDTLDLFDGENVTKQAMWLADKELINERLRLTNTAYSVEKKKYISFLGAAGVGVVALLIAVYYLSKKRKKEAPLSQLSFLNQNDHVDDESGEPVSTEVVGGVDSATLLSESILNSHLLTEEKWNQFKHGFALKYPNSYQSLRRDFPELSESNLRIVLLWRLNLTTKEIGSLLGVSADAVKKSKQRLRKKMGEEKYSQFLTFIEGPEQ